MGLGVSLELGRNLGGWTHIVLGRAAAVDHLVVWQEIGLKVFFRIVVAAGGLAVVVVLNLRHFLVMVRRRNVDVVVGIVLPLCAIFVNLPLAFSVS